MPAMGGVQPAPRLVHTLRRAATRIRNSVLVRVFRGHTGLLSPEIRRIPAGPVLRIRRPRGDLENEGRFIRPIAR